MSQPDRAALRNPWPIIRFLAHSRSWASCGRSLALGEKPKSATLRAKEWERKRFAGFLNTEAQRHRDTEKLKLNINLSFFGQFTFRVKVPKLCFPLISLHFHQNLCAFVPLCLCVKNRAVVLRLKPAPLRGNRLTGSVLNSSNRGADDLGFFAVGNERHLNVNRREWRKSRIIGRIRPLRSERTVPFPSADFRVFRSKKQPAYRPLPVH